METNETKLPVRNLERIISKSYKTYEDADFQRKTTLDMSKPGSVAKAKIFARYDGTYDLVLYKKIETTGVKIVKTAVEESADGQEVTVTHKRVPVHGQKSKDRKKDQRKK